jgi:hypothetical protein
MLPPRASALACLLGHLLPLGVIAWTLLYPVAAFAGVETRVASSTTTLELVADGLWTVRHELTLDARGTTLSSFSLRGVDGDAVPLPDATLTRLSGGQAAGPPQPVLVQARGAELELTVPSARTLRGTSFLLRLAYRTRLSGATIHPLEGGERAELGWLGPRFDDGVDAVTLILRTPAGRTPPEIVTEQEPGPQYGIVSSTLRRSGEADELELVRAHVARDEAVRWNVRIDRSLLGASLLGASPLDTTPLEGAAPVGRAAIDGASPALPGAPAGAGRLAGVACIGALGAAYTLLAWFKGRAVASAARARAAAPRPWLRWSPGARALAGGITASGAGAVAIFDQPPWLGAAGLLLAMALGAHHPPAPGPSLLGPGEWRPQGLDVLAPRPTPALPGAWLDAGRVRGFALFAAALGSIAALAARAFAGSPYTGACILLGGALLLPIFCTGRAAELPFDALEQSRRFLGDVARRLGTGGTAGTAGALAADGAFAVSAIGRVAAASGELDELRLSFAPTRPVPGLRGIELGIERRARLGGFSARPVIVVRAAEGSECQRALPRGLTWMRGRGPDERASLVRPKLPSAASSVALLRELCELLAPAQVAAGAEGAPAPEDPARMPSAKKARKSSGKGLSTAKAGTRPSPVQAT